MTDSADRFFSVLARLERLQPARREPNTHPSRFMAWRLEIQRNNRLMKMFGSAFCAIVFGVPLLFLISITPGWVIGWALVVGAIFVAPAAFSRLP